MHKYLIVLYYRCLFQISVSLALLSHLLFSYCNDS